MDTPTGLSEAGYRRRSDARGAIQHNRPAQLVGVDARNPPRPPAGGVRLRLRLEPGRVDARPRDSLIVPGESSGRLGPLTSFFACLAAGFLLPSYPTSRLVG